MLTFKLFNVRHGFCAYAEGPNGTNTLFDCGHDEETGFSPSSYFPATGVTNINRMVLGNFDTDHASDLHNFTARVNVQHFVRNRSLTPDQLRLLKLSGGPLSPGIREAIRMHAEWIHPNTPIDYGGVNLTTFWNDYGDFPDSTNNLSVVSFLEYSGTCICIPGDIERAGWQKLLEKQDFRRHLCDVNVLVASHHGRLSGYCPEVFEYCQPAVILISDKEVIHETQIHQYSKHATGITWNGSPTEKRYVLTTRCDGDMVLTKTLGQPFHINVGKIERPLLSRSAASF